MNNQNQLSHYNKHSCKLSDILLINNYKLDVFDEYNLYFNANNIIGDDYWCNRTRYRDCFNYIATNINNQQVSIIHPITKQIMESDFYFFVTSELNVIGHDLFCCYYFKGSNIILTSITGGIGLMNSNEYALIHFESKTIYYTYVLNVSEYVLNKIILKKKEIDDLNDYEHFLRTIPKETITFYGHHNNIGHQIFNEYSGIYIIQKTKIFNNTDKIILGPNNALHFNEYFSKNYPDLNIVETNNINSFDNICGRGIVYKYNHHFVSEDMKLYLYNNIINNNLISMSEESKLIIQNLNKNAIKLLIILRCGSRNMVDQENTICDFIKMFKNDYPESTIILSGFTNNNHKYDELNVGYFNQSYNDIKNQYIDTANSIIQKSEISDIYNINDFNFKETFIISKICNFSIYQHGSASCIPAWLCNVPGIAIGFHDVNRYISIDKYINQYNNLYYLTENNIIKHNITCDHIYTFKINTYLFYKYFISKFLLHKITQ